MAGRKMISHMKIQYKIWTSDGHATSDYYEVQGSGNKAYKVTINYGQGHWCTCRGMISKKSSWGPDAGNTAGTSCKHINQIISQEYDGDWGIPYRRHGKNSDGSRSRKRAASPDPAPPNTTGRRAAIMATRAKREAARVEESTSGGTSLLDRIASLEAARSGANS